MQNIAVTGASGFLGRHLVNECMRQGRYRVRALSRHRDKTKFLSGALDVCEGDLLHPESLASFMLPGSTLIHLAYISENPQANLRATQNLINSAKKVGISRIVHCSTAVVVGFRESGIITEDSVPCPRGGYQQIKYEIEKMLIDQMPSSVELAILRPTEIFGLSGRYLKPMISRLKNGSRFKNSLLGILLGNRRLNYVSVHNVVEALLFLVASPIEMRGETFFISDDDDPMNCYADVESIIQEGLHEKAIGKRSFKLPLKILPAIFKLMPGGHSRPDRSYSNKKIRQLGYRPKVSLRSAILEMVRSMEQG